MAECFRRLLLAPVIGIASGDSALAPVLGFLLCLLFRRLFSKRPFKKDDNSTLGIVKTYALSFIFLGALLIKVDAQPNGELERRIFEIVLVLLLVIGPGLIVINFLRPFCMKRAVCYKKQTMVPGQLSGRAKRTEMLRPRRQASLVRSKEYPSVAARLPRTGVGSGAINLGFSNSRESGIMRHGASNPMTTLDNGIELKEIKEMPPGENFVEDGTDLGDIKDHATAVI